MDFTQFRLRPCRLAGLFGARSVTRLFAPRLPYFLARGLPHPRVMPALLAAMFGLADAICPPLLVAGSRRGAGRLAQPRRRAKQIGFDLAFDVAVAAAIAAPGVAFVTVLVAAVAAVLAVLAARRIV